MLLLRSETDANLSSVAALIGESARATMLIALMDGLSLPAGELAELAGVSPQTASTHLQKLLEGNLVKVEIHGRHRYYQLKNSEVADALEALMVLIPSPKVRVPRNDALSQARTCYDHLAGQLGVRLEIALTQQLWLTRSALTYEITALGTSKLEAFGIPAKELILEPRYAKACLDWTERRYHLGGALGRALTTRFLELKWLVRLENTRALRLTLLGQRGLEEVFGVQF